MKRLIILFLAIFTFLVFTTHCLAWWNSWVYVYAVCIKKVGKEYNLYQPYWGLFSFHKPTSPYTCYNFCVQTFPMNIVKCTKKGYVRLTLPVGKRVTLHVVGCGCSGVKKIYVKNVWSQKVKVYLY